MYRVNVNGKDYESARDMKLLVFLREELHLTGTKDGCSEGACGACTVLVDGRKTKACVPLLSKLEGRRIVTIEGLSDREKAVYSYAFAKAGAVQCGFCTPGMVMSAKSLLDENLNPGPEDVKKAIRGNICRCTGYVKIEDAIMLAARILREGLDVPSPDDDPALSGRMARVDAEEKTLGTGIYTDDIHLEGMLYGKCLRSAYPRARVLSIDTSRAIRHPSCVRIITAADVPVNEHGHIIKDWPVFIAPGQLTHYTGDAICMVVGEKMEDLDEILSLVDVEYEVLEGVFDAQSALKDDIPVHEGRTNVMSHEHIERGDADGMLAKCRHTVSLSFSTGHTEHAFMEPECAVALYDESNDGVTVYTSGQSIFDEVREISHMLDIPQERVRCISALVGGGFGGKEDMSVQHHAALAAWLVKRPVKVKLSRQESLEVHPKRHPMDIDLTLGCDGNGRLKALRCRIVADTGAYASLGGPVLQRACTHAAGPYNYQDIFIEGYAMYTNNVPSGAFRGFGVTQSCYAIEEAMDVLAAKVGMDPFEFRYLNALRPGDTMPNGQIAGPDTGIRECLDAVRDAYFHSDRTGIACALKNSGVGVGVEDTGRCIISIEDGMVHVRTSAACMGQGLATVMTQIAGRQTRRTAAGRGPQGEVPRGARRQAVQCAFHVRYGSDRLHEAPPRITSGLQLLGPGVRARRERWNTEDHGRMRCRHRDQHDRHRRSDRGRRRDGHRLCTHGEVRAGGRIREVEVRHARPAALHRHPRDRDHSGPWSGHKSVRLWSERHRGAVHNTDGPRHRQCAVQAGRSAERPAAYDWSEDCLTIS